jgi:hypothetical protein
MTTRVIMFFPYTFYGFFYVCNLPPLRGENPLTSRKSSP